jgi:glutaminyl-tRNA synthetase
MMPQDAATGPAGVTACLLIAAKAAPLPDGPVGIFMGMGLPKQRAEETVKNAELSELLIKLSEQVGGALDRSQGILLYELAVKRLVHMWIAPHMNGLVGFVGDGQLKTTKQLEAAFAFLQKEKGDTASDDFAKASGLGVVVTEADMVREVTAVIEGAKAKLVVDRYRTNTGVLLGKVRSVLPWADGAEVKKLIDSQLATLLGPKTAADNAKPEKKAKTKAPKDPKAQAAKKVAEKPKGLSGLKLHDVGQNDKTDLYQVTDRTAFQLAAHFKRINGQVRTRFPPEPNGILHIGHAKAICINFGYAEVHNGITFLRYDDTNPEKEEERFFTGIAAAVNWLGFSPYKITHSSDYFQQLYELAVGMIERNEAYVCHQQADELKGHETRIDSPWRNRPIAESLKLFDDMKNGKAISIWAVA